MRQEAVAISYAIVAFVTGAVSYDPGHSRGQEGGRSTKLFAVVSFNRSRCGAPLDRRLCNVEDANSPWSFSGLEEPSPYRVDL
jgi:hypothetical protein